MPGAAPPFNRGREATSIATESYFPAASESPPPAPIFLGGLFPGS